MKRKKLPLLLYRERRGKCILTDGDYHSKGMSIPYEGRWTGAFRIYGPTLKRLINSYPENEMIELNVTDTNLELKYNGSIFKCEFLGRCEEDKIEKKDLPYSGKVVAKAAIDRDQSWPPYTGFIRPGMTRHEMNTLLKNK